MLRAASKPVATGWLRRGREIVRSGFGYVILPTLRVGQPEVGHMQARLEEVPGTVAVSDHVFVERNRSRAIAFILGEVGLFKAEEVVMRKLLGQAALHCQRLRVAAVVP